MFVNIYISPYIYIHYIYNISYVLIYPFIFHAFALCISEYTIMYVCTYSVCRQVGRHIGMQVSRYVGM